LTGVGKTFADGTRALGPLDLEIARSSFVAILGPSGCGKSTLLRLIAGLTEASSGRIEFAQGGRPLLGFVFQEPTLMPWRNVARNVALPLELKTGPDEARIAQALDSVGLAPFAKSYPRQLSGGMKMRVSIARALVTKPQLLLMDEPFAALDEMTRNRLNRDLLACWLADRFTCLFVTHSVYESVYLAERIIVLSPRPGRIVADLEVGTPSPRSEEFRLSSDYAAIAREVSAALRHAMGEAA
jgi:NitT/TauT family transport system ATP-binding protein